MAKADSSFSPPWSRRSLGEGGFLLFLPLSRRSLGEGGFRLPENLLDPATAKSGRPFSPIQRAADSEAGAIEHMRINHRGRNIFVSQQFLDGTNIRATFQ